MKTLLASIGMATVIAFPVAASADDVAPTVTATVTKEITVVGRPARPNVVIELTRPTAAREAGAAHDALRRALVAQAAPTPLK